MNQEINIPNGWHELEVGKIFTYLRSFAFSRANLTDNIITEGEVGNIHYGDIHSTYSSTSIHLKDVQIPLINDKNFTPNPEDLLKDGDLVMADASEDYDGVGVTVSIHGVKNNKIVGGLHTFVLRDSNENTDEYYRQFIFSHPLIKNQLKKIANGVSVYGISKSALSKFHIVLPPLPEQKRIVAVLEVWDKAIEKLSKKFELKKEIKKGLMQQLLTGSTRLSGFTDEWQTVKLGELYEITSSKRVFQSDWKSEGIPFYRAREIVKLSDHGVVDNDLFISREMFKTFQAKYGVPKINDLLVTGVGTIGILYRVKDEKEFYFKDGNIIWFKDKGLVSSNYIEQLFKTAYIKKQILGSSPITTVATYTIDSAKKTNVLLPSRLEQAAISDILTPADTEITILEKKFELLKYQKKYLLNNLITGAIRTPEDLLTKEAAKC